MSAQLVSILANVLLVSRKEQEPTVLRLHEKHKPTYPTTANASPDKSPTPARVIHVTGHQDCRVINCDVVLACDMQKAVYLSAGYAIPGTTPSQRCICVSVHISSTYR